MKRFELLCRSGALQYSVVCSLGSQQPQFSWHSSKTRKSQTDTRSALTVWSSANPLPEYGGSKMGKCSKKMTIIWSMKTRRAAINWSLQPSGRLTWACTAVWLKMTAALHPARRSLGWKVSTPDKRTWSRPKSRKSKLMECQLGDLTFFYQCIPVLFIACGIKLGLTPPECLTHFIHQSCLYMNPIVNQAYKNSTRICFIDFVFLRRVHLLYSKTNSNKSS